MDMIYVYKSPIQQSGIYNKHVIELDQYILSLSLYFSLSHLSLYVNKILL